VDSELVILLRKAGGYCHQAGIFIDSHALRSSDEAIVKRRETVGRDLKIAACRRYLRMVVARDFYRFGVLLPDPLNRDPLGIKGSAGRVSVLVQDRRQYFGLRLGLHDGRVVPLVLAREGGELQQPGSGNAVDRFAGALAAVPVFAGLEDEDRRELARLSAERLYGTGETIVREGDSGGSMFVVCAGRVRVTLAPEHPVCELVASPCTGSAPPAGQWLIGSDESAANRRRRVIDWPPSPAQTEAAERDKIQEQVSRS
jgi:hypothetical protein